MRLRTLNILISLALVIAACGGTAAEDTTTTAAEPATTFTQAPTTTEASGVRLAYALEPGTSFTYEVSIDQRIDLSTTGDTNAMGDEELPGEAEVSIVGTTVFTHSVAEGPEPGTYEVTITGDFTDLAISGTVDGAPIDEAELPDFAQIDPVDVTIVVDDQGNIILDEGLGGDLGGDLGAFGALGDLGDLGGLTAPGLDPGRWVGPPFADREVTVGDSWSETIESPVMLGEDPVVTQIDSVVTGTDTVDGATVFVIDTTSTTSMIEFDLADFLIGFFQAFIPEDASEEDKAELDALADELRFLFSIDETVGDMTTWFDYEMGYARKVDYSMGTAMTMDINMPDEETGEMVQFGMAMTIEQTISYRLVDAPTA